MCELFAINSEQDIYANDLLREFFSHSEKHKDGWGLATFHHGAVSLEKEPQQAIKSKYLKERLQHKINAKLLMAHIRYATVGNTEYDNCHPFLQRDNHNRCWVQIHNGTIFDAPALSPFQYQQEGNTDSERILLYLVSKINERESELDRPLDAQERFFLLDQLIADLSIGNRVNLIIYDGELMYVHANYADSLYVSESKDTAVFCTTPLKAGVWNPVPFTTLCAYKNGKRVLQGKPHGHEYIDNKDNTKFLFTDFSGL